MYAALTPSPQTAGPLRAACRTWADHLWALVSVAYEERLSSGLTKVSRESFWEGGLAAVDGDGDQGSVRRSTSVEIDDDTEEDNWERDVSAALESLSSVGVEDG